MAHIDNTYVETMIGADVWDGLTDDTADVKTQLLSTATGYVDDALRMRGYAVPSSAGESVKSATLGALLPLAYGRKGLSVPEQLRIHINLFNRIADVKDGWVPDGLIPATDAGIGGVSFTESSASVSGAVPSVFGGLRSVF